MHCTVAGVGGGGGMQIEMKKQTMTKWNWKNKHNREMRSTPGILPALQTASDCRVISRAGIFGSGSRLRLKKCLA